MNEETQAIPLKKLHKQLFKGRVSDVTLYTWAKQGKFPTQDTIRGEVGVKPEHVWRINELIEALKAKEGELTLNQFADKHQVHPNTVAYWIKKGWIKSRKRSETKKSNYYYIPGDQQRPTKAKLTVNEIKALLKKAADEGFPLYERALEGTEYLRAVNAARWMKLPLEPIRRELGEKRTNARLSRLRGQIRAVLRHSGGKFRRWKDNPVKYTSELAWLNRLFGSATTAKQLIRLYDAGTPMEELLKMKRGEAHALRSLLPKREQTPKTTQAVADAKSHEDKAKTQAWANLAVSSLSPPDEKTAKKMSRVFTQNEKNFAGIKKEAEEEAHKTLDKAQLESPVIDTIKKKIVEALETTHKHANQTITILMAQRVRATIPEINPELIDSAAKAITQACLENGLKDQETIKKVLAIARNKMLELHQTHFGVAGWFLEE